MKEWLFSKDHVWIQAEGNLFRVGISRFAREELGEIVYIEFPSIGKTVTRDEPICAFDSLKSSSEVYAPVSGTIREVNGALTSNLKPINEDPENSGWLLKVEPTDPSELKDLMDAARYEAFTRG